MSLAVHLHIHLHHCSPNELSSDDSSNVTMHDVVGDDSHFVARPTYKLSTVIFALVSDHINSSDTEAEQNTPTQKMYRAPALLSALILTLALIANFLTTAEGACFLERGVTTPGEHDVYTCLRSKELKKDLDRLSLDSTKLVNVVFREGKLIKIERETFQKLGTKALGISVVQCGVTDVDEDAFRGLLELKALVLRRNRIAEVKKAWFKDISKLESLDLSGNLIRQFDATIFDLTPLIQEFEISENQLTRFDVEAMKSKWPKLKKVGLQSNPYEWAEGVKIVEYTNLHPSIVKNSYAAIDGIRDTYKVIKECQHIIAKKDDAKELDDCVQTKLVKAIELPKLLEGESSAEPVKPTQ
ncbi:PREDICTED: uncharacterized protein LOC105362809 [Ceratosolen solmsi marchali]|uniref:Uncharacterized protein LOC105362809 n=1 Tax=Ceratosolen solmsi marchali TaxID=326594 RepID=A0AAJ6YIC2_9HYME|nr:PREDICTED: uncharacterized protein LOC105362809 [Ceratosolen solmsi marchali]